MGYLSQKKRSNREAFFLMFSAYATGTYTVLTLIFNIGFLRDALFHIYVLELVFLFYSLLAKKYLYVGIFTLFAIIGYFQISSATPIFFHNRLNNTQTISLLYNFEKSKLADNKYDVIEGSITINEHKSFSFLQVLTDKDQPMIISVELDKESAQKRDNELKILADFIREQDVSVVVIGDFGVPAWSAEIREFVEETGLNIKNSVSFSKKDCKFCYLSSPSFYILGFNNVGIELLEVNRSIPQIKILLGFKNI